MKKRILLVATITIGLINIVYCSTVVFCATKGEVRRTFKTYHPQRRANTYVNYVDVTNGQTVASQRKEQHIYQRTVTIWTDDKSVRSASNWEVVVTPKKIVSPDLSDKGYTAPDIAIVTPAYRAKPLDDDYRTNSFSKTYEYVVRYKHRVVTATAENPGDPSLPLEASRPDGPKWPEGTTKKDLIHDISRTIQYLDKKTHATLSPQLVQQVNYTRNANVDAVTGTFLTYSTWSSTNPVFAAVTSPKLAGQGYKLPNPEIVPETTTTFEDSECSVIVNYEASKVTIEAKNSTMIAGPNATWIAKDNFIGAKDQNGDAVDFKHVKVEGTVDETKVGKYDITYSYTDENDNTVRKTIVVDVVASKLSLDVKDSIISVNSTSVWSPKDNFISATDQDGKPLDIKQVDVTGSVDTTKPGKYEITYSYTDSQGNKIVKKSTVITMRRLTFKEVPEVLAFNESKIANRTTEVSRKNSNWKMIVEDSREEKSPWRITAKLTSPFKNSSGESTLGDILLYRKVNQADQWINSTNEVTVFDGRSNKDMDQYDVSWSQNEGPMIQVAPGTVKASGYTSIIQWSLTDAPV